jgi:O-antigen/teichoic acid export membrane protein
MITSKLRFGQAGSLYVAVILGVIIGIGSSMITTRLLQPDDYGNLKFIQNFYQLLATISSLGILPTGALLLARLKENDRSKHELIGAIILLTVGLSFIFILLSVGFSFFENQWFSNNLGHIILIFSPILAVLIFQPCLEYILQGDNRIYLMSLFRILPGLLFILVLVGLKFFIGITLSATLLIQLITAGFVTLLIVFLLKPRYSNFRKHRQLILATNKQYGWHVYVGSISSVATSYLSTFVISYYLDNANVGYYSLAVTLSMPLMQIANVVGTTYFKEFAGETSLPKKITLTAVGLTTGAALIFIVLIRYVVVILYTEKFLPVVALAYLTAIGSSLFGLGDYVNRFLQAKGKGKELRNSAFIVGFVNIVGYFLLVRFFGVIGAAMTQFCAGLVYLAAMMFFYREYKKRISTENIDSLP